MSHILTGRGAAIAAASVGALSVAYSALYTVEGGHRAIKFSRLHGVLPAVHAEGTHVLVPIVERAIVFDVRARPRTFASLTGTRDLQMVNVSLRVLARPDASALAALYRRLGTDWDERLLPSLAHEVLKSVVAQFTAVQLVTQRERVSKAVRARLVERALSCGVILDDVSLTAVQFSDEFASSVEAKQIAQQEAQRAAFVVDRARQERESMIVRAAGEAAAARLVGEATRRSPAFLELRRIEAARESAASLASGSNTRVLLDASILPLSRAAP